GGIAIELGGQGAKKHLGLGWIEPFDAPHDLIFFRRCIENEVGNRCFSTRSNRPQRGRRILIEVEIHMANFKNARLGSSETPGTERIHPDEYVRAGTIFLSEPILKWRTGNILREKNSLRGLLSLAIANKNRYTIFGAMQSKDILWRRQLSWFEVKGFGHECSLGAT